MTISFKSVGKTQAQSVANQLVVSPTPIGIKTPLRPGTSEGVFAMHYRLADQVHDNLRNLILTNWGERVGLYDLGANLRPLLSEYVSQDDFDTQAVERINGTVSKWMPYVSLETFESKVSKNIKNTDITMTIVYSVPALNIVQKALEVTLRIM